MQKLVKMECITFAQPMTMANKLALVLVGSSSPTEGSLQLESGETIEVGSKAWFEWLELNPSFRFESGFAGDDSFTARKHERDSGEFWYAYRKVDRQLKSLYLGKTRCLTVQRLLEAAKKLSQPPQPKAESYAKECITLPNQPNDPTEPNVKETAGAQPTPTVSELQAKLGQLNMQLIEVSEENVALKDERDQLRHQLGDMAGKAGEWYDKASLCEQRLQNSPDLDAVRDRILQSLKLGKQAPEYKRTKATLARFIAELRGESS